MINYNNFDRFLDDNELKSEMRDLKLKLVSGEFDFKINKDFLRSNKKLFRFIKSNFPNDIVSGSIVLKAYGLLSRESNDLDILINNSSRYSSYRKGDYGEAEETHVSNRLGYVDVEYKDGFFSFKKKYKVDFFENLSASYNIVDGIKFHNPIEVLNCKMNMTLGGYSESSRKHRKDLTDVFRMMYIHSLAKLDTLETFLEK